MQGTFGGRTGQIIFIDLGFDNRGFPLHNCIVLMSVVIYMSVEMNVIFTSFIAAVLDDHNRRILFIWHDIDSKTGSF